MFGSLTPRTPTAFRVPAASAQPPSEPTRSFPKHEKFYYDDGSVTFLIEGTLYRPHRSWLVKHSPDFGEHLKNVTPAPLNMAIISMASVKATDFDAFLSVLYPSDLNDQETDVFTVDGWTSVLHLATKWHFASARARAIRHLQDITQPFERLVLGRTYGVDDWVVPALAAVCMRWASLNVGEIELLLRLDLACIGAVRDYIHRSPVQPSSQRVSEKVCEWLQMQCTLDLDGPASEDSGSESGELPEAASENVARVASEAAGLPTPISPEVRMPSSSVASNNLTLKTDLGLEGLTGPLSPVEDTAPMSPKSKNAKKKAAKKAAKAQGEKSAVDAPSLTVIT
ncbi:hypothetical protein FA95DRAFT_1490244 [Auriscalpium vulgare]|uniref:Uncharacterized protein n=1 Tax=Auriscalpium vulgare TaxID=40419 RepID=A0ACB8RYG3_9AGAM|nr:hypothetical protein FA95DRAFT_1490244 [Auriscalpium vulgare]